MKNPSTFQRDITARIKHDKAKGIPTYPKAAVNLIFGSLNSFSHAAVINLAESITQRIK